jgi:hypothetical protein
MCSNGAGHVMNDVRLDFLLVFPSCFASYAGILPAASARHLDRMSFPAPASLTYDWAQRSLFRYNDDEVKHRSATVAPAPDISGESGGVAASDAGVRANLLPLSQIVRAILEARDMRHGRGHGPP